MVEFTTEFGSEFGFFFVGNFNILYFFNIYKVFKFSGPYWFKFGNNIDKTFPLSNVLVCFLNRILIYLILINSSVMFFLHLWYYITVPSLLFFWVVLIFYVINPGFTNCSDLLRETTFSFVYPCYLILFHIYIIPYFIQYYLPFINFYNKYIDDWVFAFIVF